MIREINNQIRKVNKYIGVTVPLPKDDSKSLKKYATINGTVAVSILGLGLLFNSKSLIGLSVLSGLGAFITYRESKN
ncbi:MAG: hypothetical protein RR565_07520 [Erysipelothrix sp.]